MKRLLGLLTLLTLTGCAVVPAERSGQAAALSPPQAGTVPRYEYQLEVVYTDGATPFLHLAEVQNP